MSDREFSIVHISPPQITEGGDFIYRLTQPDRALGKIKGVISASVTNIISSRVKLTAGADILIIQMLGDPDLLPVIMDRKKRGLTTVFEISDNFLDFQSSNPAARFYEIPENRACLIQLAKTCDAVQTTTPALRDVFSHLNDNIRVFENRMEELGNTEKAHDCVVIGWGGSSGHYEDINEIAPALMEWLSGKPEEIKLAIMGIEKFGRIFDSLPPNRFIYRKAGSLRDYYDFVQSLHIGIAPLLDDSFNRCRSDVKFMEYASRGAVPVCSDIPTYNRTLKNGETGFLFNGKDDLFEVLDRLIDDPEKRSQISNNAFSYIQNERMEEDGAAQRLDFYRSIHDKKNRGKLNREHLENDNSLALSHGTNHFLHEMTIAEKHIYEGMMCRTIDGNPEKALYHFGKSMEIEPECYLSLLYSGDISTETEPVQGVEYLEKALSVNPISYEARIHLTRAHKCNGDSKKAMETINECISFCPDHARGWTAKAELEINESLIDNAIISYKQALEVNSYYVPAMTGLGVIYLERSEYEKSELQFRNAIEIAPRSCENHYGLGLIFSRTNRIPEAATSFILSIRTNQNFYQPLDALLKICKELYKNNDFKKVIEYLEEALIIKPHEPELLFWLARSKHRIGDTDGAHVAAERLYEIDNSGRFSNHLKSFL